jgi:hypothetical protein
MENMNEDRSAKLAALGNTLKTLRDEAVKARADSGIEAEWLEDEEYFQGIDDANRDGKAIKPTSPDGRVIIEKQKNKKTSRSTVFVNITRPYVNAASAKLADMLFPTDDSNFGMRPTPIPDLINKSKDFGPAFDANGQPVTKTLVDENGQPVMQPQMNGDQPVIGPDGRPVTSPVQKQATNADVAEEEMKQAKESCEKAEKQINDWLVQCGYHGEGRQVIEDSARIGTGVLKGPFPENVRKRAVVKALAGIGMIIKDELVPKSRCISVWNLYPDGACGESIHNGKHVWEYDQINTRKLSELKRDPSYIASAIDQAIEEGPKNRATGTSKRPRGQKANDKEMFDVWYFTGYLAKDDLETAGYEFEKEPAAEEEEVGLMAAPDMEEEEPEQEDDAAEDMAEGEATEQDGIEEPEIEEPEEECACEDKNKQYPALVVMVNDLVIKATLQPLDSGEFPYDVMPWQRRAGHWAGIGVARQMRTSQDGVNAATRNLMDNAGASGSPILIIDRSKIVPADGKWNLGAQKVYYTAEGAELDDVRKAFTWILAPSMQQELMAIIQFWMQRAEDETGLPMLLQGQLGRAPDTVGGMTMLNNNASSVLRRIARIFDDAITEPHIGRYYEWLLMHVEDESMKGDFTIDARGSSALIERDMQSQVLMQMLGSSANPIFGLDPELVMQEFLKAQRFDADKLKLSDEKKKQMQEAAQAQAQSGAQDPRLQIAQMREEGRQAEIAAKQQAEEQKRQFDSQQADLDRALTQWEKNVDAQIAAAQLGGEQTMLTDELKAGLAKEAVKLRTQIALARQTMRPPQVATPAMEPIGRAPDGQAFQK